VNRLLKTIEMPLLNKAALPKVAASNSVAMAPNSYLTLASSSKSLLRLEKGWRELETASHVPATIFQSFDWVKTWCEIYAQPESDVRVLVVTGYTNDQLVFILPLEVSKFLGITRATWLSQPIAQYGDLLCHRQEDPSHWMGLAIEFLKSSSAIDVLHLRHVRQSSNLYPFAERSMGDGKLNERAPYLDLTTFSNDTEYEGRYDSRQRKHRKKIRKGLEEFGELSFIQLSDQNEIDAAIDYAVVEKRKWLKQRGRFNRTMACPRHNRFLQALARLDDKGATLQVTQMSAGEHKVSWEASFVYKHVQYCYLTAHQTGFTNRSPGRLHFDLSQRRSLAQGIKTYDLMVPYDPYKDSWSSATEPVNDYYLGISKRGELFGRVYFGTLRPVFRNIYAKLPIPILRVLKTLLRQ
jgi:CelD/BcsL family acetyltransferase involved in cellulose biosynthesis